ncbi:MAG TPA: deoxyribodipyrimidine photo-lyase [Polyangia bacterium]
MWFRQDLRLADHPALTAAVARAPVVPVFIWSPEELGDAAPGAASRWWLHQSLGRLDESLRGLGSRLIIRRGPFAKTLHAIATEVGADAVFWSRCHEPAWQKVDREVCATLERAQVKTERYPGALLFDPDLVRTAGGGPFQVFSAFWRACLAQPSPAPPLPAPSHARRPRSWPTSCAREELALEPKIDWATGIRAAWTPGEHGAQQRLREFVAGAGSPIDHYEGGRNRPGSAGTSRLSPHLHHGEISPRQIWQAIADRTNAAAGDASTFLRELGWREFAHHLLVHFPKTPQEPLRPAFRRFPWAKSAAHLRAWQRGRTGYPMVDAGMRELWTTGFMHNRVRMVTASFLTKHLLLPWQEGAAWFWDTLVDADQGNNTLGWQWVSGCGADAAPYFRIFNPVIQGEKFDPRGEYVRRWLPELAGLPDRYIHAPWKASAETLRAAGVTLGADYPKPIVDHTWARARALAAYASLERPRVRAGAITMPRARAQSRTAGLSH